MGPKSFDERSMNVTPLVPFFEIVKMVRDYKTREDSKLV